MHAAEPNTTETSGFLGERIATLGAEHLLAQARAIDAARAHAGEGGEHAALLDHFRVAVQGLVTTPYMHHVGLVARDRGLVAFNRLERAFLPAPASWVHPDFGASYYATRVRGEMLEANLLWPFAQDCPAGDYQLNLPPKWWSHGLVHTLVGFGTWPGLTEWDVMHMSRLSEALAAFHWYWLAELGRLGDDTPVVDLSELKEQDAQRYLEMEMAARDPEVRDARLRSARALAVAQNGLETLQYEAFAYQFGMTHGVLLEPEQRSLGFGEACEYAKVHYPRLTSPAFRRWVERCLVPDVDYATSAAAFDLRCGEVLTALVSPCALRPDVRRERAYSVLKDVGQRLCHLAALHERPHDGYEAPFAHLCDALATLRGGEVADPDGVVGEVLARIARDVPQPPSGVGVRELLALGYAPTADPAREPLESKAARAEALIRRAWALHPAVGAGLEGVKPLALRVVDDVRLQSLTLELRDRADPAAKKGEIDYFDEAFFGWLEFASYYMGSPDGQGNLAQRWRYRLAWRTLPEGADLSTLVAMPNPYLSYVPLSFNARWLAGLVERAPGTINALKPRYATAVEYCLVGPGRRGPVLAPITPEIGELLGRLREPVRLDKLVAGGITRERIARAVADEHILVFHKPEHAAPPIEQAGPALFGASETEVVASVIEWNAPEQVDAYDTFCQRSRLYEDTSRELVRRSDVGGAQRVGDLSCGTGVTTRAILERLSPEGLVVAVDPSVNMIQRARINVPDARASFHVGTALELGYEALSNGPLPRIVCNSALWLSPDIKRELGRLRGALAPGGVLGFSIPAAILGHTEHLMTPAVERFGRALEEARAALGVGAATPIPTDPVLGSVEHMREALEVSAFAEVDFQLWNRPWSMAEYLDWLDLPVIRSGMVDAAHRDQGHELIARMRERLDPDIELDNVYYFVIARVAP